MTLRLAALLFSATLAACGGGSDDGGAAVPPASGTPSPSPPPAPGPAPSPSPAPAVRTVSYDLLPAAGSTAASLQADLNTQGARGFRYVSGLFFSGADGTRDLYAKDASATYAYEVLAAPSTAPALVSQANAQGARGYRYAGLDTRGTIYRKASDSSATFTYQTQPGRDAASSTRAYFLAQANAEGANGWRFVAPYVLGANAAPVNFYERSSSGASTYAYESVGDAGNDSALLAQFNTLGARGFRLLSPFAFAGDGSQATQWVYIRDPSQAATYEYVSFSDSTRDAFLAQSNAQGAAGYGWIGDLVAGRAARTYYFKPVACTGVLCETRSPFGG